MREKKQKKISITRYIILSILIAIAAIIGIVLLPSDFIKKEDKTIGITRTEALVPYSKTELYDSSGWMEPELMPVNESSFILVKIQKVDAYFFNSGEQFYRAIVPSGAGNVEGLRDLYCYSAGGRLKTSLVDDPATTFDNAESYNQGSLDAWNEACEECDEARKAAEEAIAAAALPGGTPYTGPSPDEIFADAFYDYEAVPDSGAYLTKARYRYEERHEKYSCPSSQLTYGHAWIFTFPIAGYKEWNYWSAGKQMAYWEVTPNQNKSGPSHSASATTQMLYQQGTQYEAFRGDSGIAGNNGNMIKGASEIGSEGGRKTFEANTPPVRVNVKQGAQEYIVGPFKVDYVNGCPNGLTGNIFGGIEDLYALRKDGSSILIEEFITRGQRFRIKRNVPQGSTAGADSYNSPFYSEMTEYSTNQMCGVAGPGGTLPDYAAMQPGDDFYVVVKEDDIALLDYVVVDFRWTDIEFCYMDLFYAYTWTMFPDSAEIDCGGYTKTGKFSLNWAKVNTIESHDKDANPPDGRFLPHEERDYDEEPYDSFTGLSGNGRNSGGHPKGGDTYDTAWQTLAMPWGERIVRKERLKLKVETYPDDGTIDYVTMRLGGHCWIEDRTLKTSELNGQKDGGEKPAKGVKVILHDETMGGGVAHQFYPDTDTYSTEPCETTTDTEGRYIFVRLNAQHKYWVEFQYNGMLYEPTHVTTGTVEAGKSHAKDDEDLRKAFNNKFYDIQTSNDNYKNGKVFSYYRYGTGNGATGETEYRSGVKAATGSILDTEDKIVKDPVDSEQSYSYNGIKEIWEGIVDEASKQSEDYCRNNDGKVKDYLYETIENKGGKAKDFIRDCIAGYEEGVMCRTEDQYPLIDDFWINLEQDKGDYPWMDSYIHEGSNTVPGAGSFPALYPQYFNIDFGLAEREQADLELKKDLLQVRLEINGKVHTYQYAQRIELDKADFAAGDYLENNWDNSLRRSSGYYDKENAVYERDIYKSDYLYNINMYKQDGCATSAEVKEKYGKTHNDELRVYLTYSVWIHNSSNAISTQLSEFIDYYDKDLQFVPDRSFIKHNFMYTGTDIANQNNNPKIAADYDSGLYNLSVPGLSKHSGWQYSNWQASTDASKSAFGKAKGASGFNTLYVTNKEGNFLSPGAIDYFYLTYAVNKRDKNGNICRIDSDGNILVNADGQYIKDGAIDDEPAYVMIDESLKVASGDSDEFIFSIGKENIAEVNGYRTIYANGVEVPNVGDVSGWIAGLVDRDSSPGNVHEVLPGSKASRDYGTINMKLFEDDSDKAPNFQLILKKKDEERIIEGMVFEDERNDTINSVATIGDGKYDREEKINGVTVQLIELCNPDIQYDADDNPIVTYSEYIWREFGNGIGESDGTDTNEHIGEYTQLDRDGPSQGADNGNIGDYDNLSNVRGKGTGNVDSERPVINSRESSKSGGIESTYPDDATNGTSIVRNYNFEGDHRGEYAFKSFMPGNFVVRYIYGDTVRTVLVSDNAGEVNDKDTSEVVSILGNHGDNKKSYNGQDYKSTVYQKGISQESQANQMQFTYNGVQYYSRNDSTPDNSEYNVFECEFDRLNRGHGLDEDQETGYLMYNGKLMDLVEDRLSDARDLTSRRKEVNRFSNNSTDRSDVAGSTVGVTNTLAEILASARQVSHYKGGSGKLSDRTNEAQASADKVYYAYDADVLKTQVNMLMRNTWMAAESGVVVFEVEKNSQGSELYPNVARLKTPGTRTKESTDYHIEKALNTLYTEPEVYKYEEVDLGLVERAKAQVDVHKQVKNVLVTLADGTVLFDAEKSASNITWLEHNNYPGINTGTLYYPGSKAGVMNDNIYRAGASGMPTSEDSNDNQKYRKYISTNGLINATMDEELMHGAKVQITYDITVTNVGEVDFDTNGFYYAGRIPTAEGGGVDTSKLVKTTIWELVDFVDNNLAFNQNINSTWKVVEQDNANYKPTDTYRYSKTLGHTDADEEIGDLVRYSIGPDDKVHIHGGAELAANADPDHGFNNYGMPQEIQLNRTLTMKKQIDEYNTIVTSRNADEVTSVNTKASPFYGKELYPKKVETFAGGLDTSVKDTIILSDILSPENKQDSLNYSNFVQLVKVSNDVGRRMAMSVVGNDDPSETDATKIEMDADMAERVTILVPFGGDESITKIAIIVSTIVGAGIIMAVGIILIKKKILTENK